jgi:uroporphyrinogen decarboxylase
MTARQRVAAAMSGATPDRVPFIPQICIPHAVRMLGLDYEETLIDVIRNPIRMNALTFQCVKAYGVSGLRTWPLPRPMDAVRIDGIWYGRDLETGERLGRVDFEGGGGVLPSEEPEVSSDEDIAAIPVRSPDEIVRSGELDGIRAILDEAGNDFFVISSPGVFTAERITFVRGKQQGLVDMLDRPDFCHRLLERTTEAAIEYARALVQVGVHGMMVADVYGGVIGPDLFREFCVPYFKRFVQAIRPSGVLIYLHVCGKSGPILELMADTGVHCIEPLDPLGGVEVHDAKRRVGQRVALMGGLDTRLLAHGTLEQVRQDAMRVLTEGMPGGGYVLACGDMLPTETSPRKVRMLLEMTETIGCYA